MKIIVTGHLGYIGKEITFRLRMLGYDVIGIDLKDGKDVRDMSNCDVAIHCAASLKDEDKYNVETTIPVINRAKKIVFLSSAAVYGNTLGANEQSPLTPINAYGVGKRECERLIRDSNKPYSIFRLSNVYSSTATHGVVARFLKGYRTINGRGGSVRDFVRLEDIVPVIVEAAVTDKWKGTFNLSSGKGISIINLFKRMSKEKPIFKPPKEEIIHSILDSSKAQKKGFKPW